MCQFISWVEVEKDGDKHIFYLIYRDIYHTKRGKDLQAYNPNTGDYIGHGAIRWYYDLGRKGKDLECTDFSTPNNFPPEIVDAIKNGKFRGLGVCSGTLLERSWAKYKKIEQSAYAEYIKIQQSAWAEYRKIEQSALAKYEKIQQSAFWDIFANPKNRRKIWR